MKKIECQTCGWIGIEEDLLTIWSVSEASCPSCGGADFLEVEEANGKIKLCPGN